MKINLLKEIGFYKYCDKIYTTKLALYHDILKNNDFSPQIKFWFSDDVFGKIDWSIEPQLGLHEMYRMRARQIRESYDYVLLVMSGGTDSTNMLESFLAEGLHVDEVVTTHPIRLIKNIPELVNPEKHPLGILYEYEYAALPILKYFHARSPQTKITELDCSDWFEQKYNNDNYVADKLNIILTRQIFQSMVCTTLMDYFDKIFDNMGQQKIGCVFANDKPHLFNQNNRLMFAFTDLATGVPGTYDFQGNNYDPILFYWTRNFPLIPIKQSHEILKAINRDRSLRQKLNENHIIFKESNSVKKILYPETYNPIIFQKAIKNQDDEIMTYFFGEHGKENTLEGKSFLEKKFYSVNEGLLNNIRPTGTNYTVGQKNRILYQSQYYYVGDIND